MIKTLYNLIVYIKSEKRILFVDINPHTKTDSQIFNKCLRTV